MIEIIRQLQQAMTKAIKKNVLHFCTETEMETPL